MCLFQRCNMGWPPRLGCAEHVKRTIFRFVYIFMHSGGAFKGFQ
jgi:hypothetical protein